MTDKPEKKRAPLLIDEPTILVYPSLAVALGINKAIVFQQLHFLLNGQKESKNTHNQIDDRWWVYNSYTEWQRDYFPWLSTSTLKGIFLELEKEGLIISKQSVKYASDRRKWYSIDYEQWDKKCLMMGQKMSDEPSDKKSPMDGTKTSRSKRQKKSDGLSETSTKVSSENSEKPAESAATPAAADPTPVPVVTSTEIDKAIYTPSQESAQAERSAKEPTPISAPPPPIDEPRAEIFEVYEQGFGLTISGVMKDELLDTAKEFSMDWIRDAIKETAMAGVKNWKYTRKILDRWKIEGRKPSLTVVPKPADSPAPVKPIPAGAFRPALPKASGDNENGKS